MNYRSIRDLDWPLIFLALSLCALGILQIYSATHDTRQASAWWKQLLYVVLGLAAMWLVCGVDYHTLIGQVPLFYGISIALLCLVLVFGTREFGSKSWIPLFGGFRFQASEFVKVLIILLTARYLTVQKREFLEGRELLKLMVLVAVPIGLILLQPDFGTAMTYLPVIAVGVFLAGLRVRHMVLLALLAVVGSGIVFQFYLRDYQKARIETFLDPALDPRGRGYQVIQSQIAIGSGKMWGKGVTQGSQTQGRFLPTSHNDFIFATFAEEHGFVGVCVALALYLLMLLQIVQNAQAAPDRTGMYICMGVASLLLFHILVNVGMVIGRMPVTGIPLPLMSAGGSSTLSMFMMLGLVHNVRMRRFVS